MGAGWVGAATGSTPENLGCRHQSGKPGTWASFRPEVQPGRPGPQRFLMDCFHQLPFCPIVPFKSSKHFDCILTGMIQQTTPKKGFTINVNHPTNQRRWAMTLICIHFASVRMGRSDDRELAHLLMSPLMLTC